MPNKTNVERLNWKKKQIKKEQKNDPSQLAKLRSWDQYNST